MGGDASAGARGRGGVLGGLRRGGPHTLTGLEPGAGQQLAGQRARGHLHL